MSSASKQIPLFERQEVDRSAVRITRAGDGLSEALTIEPKALTLGNEVFYVLRGKVRQVNHKLQGDGNEEVLTRLHTIEVTSIAEVDPPTARELLDEAADRIQRAKDERSGQMAIDAQAKAPAIVRDEEEPPAEEIIEASSGVNEDARQHLAALPTES